MTATNDGVKLSLKIDGSYVVDDPDDPGSCLEIPFRCGEVSIMGMWKERLAPEGNEDGNTAGWDWLSSSIPDLTPTTQLPWSEHCDDAAKKGVENLQKFCDDNPNVPEHSLMTKETRTELQEFLSDRFNHHMKVRWAITVQKQGQVRANPLPHDIETVRILDPTTGVESTHLTAAVSLGVDQRRQGTENAMDRYQLTAAASAKVGSDGGIEYASCYGTVLKMDDEGKWVGVRPPPMREPASWISPSEDADSGA